MIRVKTIAMLDGSIRTVELGTLEAIELCVAIARADHHTVTPPMATLMLSNIDAIEAYRITQSDDETIALDARENLEGLMRETSEAMFVLGYYADWYEGTFYIETIDEGEAD